ncbi:tripartite tricarboxylate transporter TctB family protein [Pelagibacterium sp.]|uniref:tripartite tricarboxylate transporter TctB family protein n=1 Tax=Pelagibacterium sp. TaxID=1967288 RepID=UPI003A8EE985
MKFNTASILKMRKVNLREVVAAILIMALGAFATWEGSRYGLLAGSRVGAGYLPFWIGILLMVFAAILIISELFSINADPYDAAEDSNIPFQGRSFFVLVLSIVVFSFVVVRFGLGPAVFMAVLLSGFADKSLRVWQILILASVVTALSILIFRIGLGIQIEAIKW